MSEFKFVQWGRGIPVDYQRLGQMMSNEDYLKNRIDPSPRGILAWKTIEETSYANPTGGGQNITGLTNITFNVEENRAISFEFQSGRINSDAGINIEVRFFLTIDGANTGDYAGTFVTTSNQFLPPCVYTVIPSTALTKGSHIVTANFVATNASYTLKLGQTSKTSLIIRDEGEFISPSS